MNRSSIIAFVVIAIIISIIPLVNPLISAERQIVITPAMAQSINNSVMVNGTTISSSTTSSTSSTTTTASVNTSTIPTTTIPVSKMRVLFDVPTWTSSDGFYSINWNAVSEIDIFHMSINPDSTIVYDGGLSPKISQETSIAHSHGANVTVAIGGSGESDTVISSILDNAQLRSQLVNNTINEINLRNYDGVQIDFEGCFDSTNFVTFVHDMFLKGKSFNDKFFIVLSVADWEQAGHACNVDDFNVRALSPYVRYFDVMFNDNLSQLSNWANGNSSKVGAGYDLSNADTTYHVPSLTEMKTNHDAGYSLYFYSSQLATSQLYSNIESAR